MKSVWAYHYISCMYLSCKRGSFTELQEFLHHTTLHSVFAQLLSEEVPFIHFPIWGLQHDHKQTYCKLGRMSLTKSYQDCEESLTQQCYMQVCNTYSSTINGESCWGCSRVTRNGMLNCRVDKLSWTINIMILYCKAVLLYTVKWYQLSSVWSGNCGTNS